MYSSLAKVWSEDSSQCYVEDLLRVSEEKYPSQFGEFRLISRCNGQMLYITYDQNMFGDMLYITYDHISFAKQVWSYVIYNMLPNMFGHMLYITYDHYTFLT